jgi:hypothetical protein
VFSHVAIASVVLLGAATLGQCRRATLQAADDREEAEKVRVEDDALAKQRLAVMQDRVAAFAVKGKDERFPERFEAKPIFRYSDPARGIVSAAIWRLGPKGRPKALISTELMPKFYGRPRIVYEFLSLTEAPFMTASDDHRWEPTSSALTMRPISKGPPTAASASARLVQLKQLAKRFKASEVLEGERCELRLLPTPIERYAPGDADRADGAIFLLSYGINPEALLFVESDGMDWTYGFARLGAAVISAELDDKPVWEVGPAQYGFHENYTATNAPAVIPGIDP